MTLPHRIAASIDLKALKHNLEVARNRAQGGRVLAVIKANAYGHGLIPVAEALHFADMYGVTDIHEAERLRAAGTSKPILILQGLITPDDVERIGKGGFNVVIHRKEDLAWLEEGFARTPPRQPLSFWLKLQSGMGRLGVEAQDYPKLYRALLGKPWAARVQMLTHLANSSLPYSALNDSQLRCFREVRETLAQEKPDTSIASSAGLLALDCAGHWARPGIMLYGSSPFAWQDLQRRREAFGLKNVMTLRARLISVRQHRTGDNIGYNSQFICPKPMRIGIVSCGYADGYPSNTPNGCPVEVQGKRTTTVGRVSMDMLAIDLSAIPEARLGDAVTLWGDTVPVDEVAAHTGILSYNLFCSISARVPKYYS
jgi:alanine racemase